MNIKFENRLEEAVNDFYDRVSSNFDGKTSDFLLLILKTSQYLLEKAADYFCRSKHF